MAAKGAREAAAERKRTAFEYCKAGMTYRQIAQKLGVSHTQIFKDVQSVLKEVRQETKESAEDLVDLEDARLKTTLLAIWPKVVKGELGAIDRAIKISESLRKLRGLDAPTKIAPTNPDGTKSYAADALTGLEKMAAHLAAGTDERGESRSLPMSDDEGTGGAGL